MHLSSTPYLIALGMFLLWPLSGWAGSENPLEETDRIRMLAGGGYGVKHMAEPLPDSGNIVFWGQKFGNDHDWHAEALHPILYDKKANQYIDLIPPGEVLKLIKPEESLAVIEIAASRTADRIVLNYAKAGDKPGSGITELLVYDVKSKTVALRSTDLHYHTNLSISPDGRQLAFSAQPPEWIGMYMGGDLVSGQVDVMDLATAKLSIVAEAIPGGRSMSDRLYWSPDSKFVVFAQPKMEVNKRIEVLIKWEPERQKKSEFPLEGERRFLCGLKILPDHRILVFSDHEIFALDNNFKFMKTVHSGIAMNSFTTSGTLILFNDRKNLEPGFGTPQSINID